MGDAKQIADQLKKNLYLSQMSNQKSATPRSVGDKIEFCQQPRILPTTTNFADKHYCSRQLIKFSRIL